MIVLDTDVVSELMRPAPSLVVVGWVRGHEAHELQTTAITLAEIGYGIKRLRDGQRRDRLQAAAAELFARFADQVLPFDAPAAEQYALVVAGRDGSGHPIDGLDAQIAAICVAQGSMLATRNAKDFEGTGVTLTDPWAN